MVRHLLGYVLLLFALSGCASSVATPPKPLSGQITRVEQLPRSGLRIGFVADSQLQTRGNYEEVLGYRGTIEDFFVKTAIRPPALDWAARSMLRSQLDQLHREGAEAIFYLGDGANNGCYDELAWGFRDGAQPDLNEQGVLALLDAFRTRAKIPVFFILGNHDLLGAGSTARAGPRKTFCSGTGSQHRSVAKLEAMKLTDAFNRGNAEFAGAWRYRSNWDEAAIGRACTTDAQVQHRTPGCYLAATVDVARSEGSAQFLLLDTNDWADVTSSDFAKLQQEGIRGAMSFRNDRERRILSQTGWFDENASDKANLRVALSHYDVAGLTKRIPFFGRISAKSQMYMNLFTKGTQTREPIQDRAYVATGHTHVRDIDGKLFTFSTDCGPVRCAKTNRFEIRELNVGSTTDYSNYSTVAQLEFEPEAGGLSYRRVESEPGGCKDVWDAIPSQTFPHKLRGKDIGWAAIGIDLRKRANYRKFGFADVQLLWANLDAYAGNDPHKSNCIGLYAAAVEVGVDPLKRLPPKRKAR